MQTSPDQSYPGIIKLFHWVIAVTVISMLAFGFFLEDIPKTMQGLAYMMHKSTGITIFFLSLIWLVLIHTTPKPALPDSVPVWQKIAARLVQYGLLILLLAMPLAGWIMSMAADKIPVFFGLFQAKLPFVSPDKALAKLMNTAHKTMAWVMIAFIGIHVLAALKHHFIDKDNILKRML